MSLEFGVFIGLRGVSSATWLQGLAEGWISRTKPAYSGRAKPDTILLYYPGVSPEGKLGSSLQGGSSLDTPTHAEPTAKPRSSFRASCDSGVVIVLGFGVQCSLVVTLCMLYYDSTLDPLRWYPGVWGPFCKIPKVI